MVKSRAENIVGKEEERWAGYTCLCLSFFTKSFLNVVFWMLLSKSGYNKDCTNPLPDNKF